jgi:hypothetical protein
MGNSASGNVPELPNSTFMFVIRQVPNGNNVPTLHAQLQALYTPVKHWEELIDLVKPNCTPIEPYCLTAIYKKNLTREELDE